MTALLQKAGRLCGPAYSWITRWLLAESGPALPPKRVGFVRRESTYALVRRGSPGAITRFNRKRNGMMQFNTLTP